MTSLSDNLPHSHGLSTKANDPDFSGRWFTTFGVMELKQEGEEVHGTYVMQQNRCTIEGQIREGRFRFSYREPAAEGEGWFDLWRYGRFAGEWRAQGASNWSAWRGDREFEGIWDTSFGLLRLVQQANGVIGFYEGAGPCSLQGRLEEGRLQFRYHEAAAGGEGVFALTQDATHFEGKWRPDGGEQWSSWHGRRVIGLPGVVWLIVIEAHWQRSYLDKEYAFGHMLREFFSRLPHVSVRQRFFEDETGLERWCRELMYIPEPVAVLLASHGTAEGLTVHGRPFATERLVESLRFADNVVLLHFSCCMMMQDGKAGELARALQKTVRFPISGYDRSVDWAASALLEFHYLDMVLARGLSPADAAASVCRLLAYASNHEVPESPYRAAGFRILLPKPE